MDQRSGKNWYSFVVLAAIGMIGASGQAALLYNDLVHSYPFKMMHSPPAEFYQRIGQLGYCIALSASFIGVVYAVRLRRILVAIVPVVLSPLAYWLTFGAAHVIAGRSSAEMTERNFEGATGYSNIIDVSSTSLTLIIAGSLVAFGLSFILLKLESIWRSSYEKL